MTGYVNTYEELMDRLQKTDAVRSMNISIEDRYYVAIKQNLQTICRQSLWIKQIMKTM